jgi:PAS domain S-box-containing protein
MAPYTVLYIDDEPDLLLLGKEFLESIGDFAIDTRPSALEALETLRTRSYDAIISDYQMPEMDGLTFLKTVREEFGDIPFILFTGRGRESVVIEAINYGVDFYLQKGGDVKAQFAELAHKVKKAVERKRAIDEHIASEKRLSSLFDASPIHQMISEFSTGRILDLNDRFLKDLQLPRAEVIGKTLEEIGFVVDPVQYSQILNQMERDGTARNIELLVRSRDGRTYVTLTSMTRVQVHDQDLIYTQSMDITARKKSQQTINALLNAPPDVSFLFDTRGVILAVNDAASSRFQIPAEDLIGMDAYTLMSPEYATLRREKVSEVITAGKPLVYIDDRSGHSFENHLFPVLGPDREVTAVAVYSHDITEECRAKEALRESEAKYRLVVEHSHDSIYIHRDNRFFFINRQAEEFSGYSHEELMQREIWDFIHPDDRERLKESAMKRLSGGQVSTSFEARVLRKNGEVRDGEFFVDLVEFLGTPAILGIARDITEKKRAEDAIREREEQIRSLADNLPQGMVYQIRTGPGGKKRFVHISAGVERLHEIKAEDVLRDPSLLHTQLRPEDRHRLKEAEDRAVASMSPLTFEGRVRTPSGVERWILLRSAPRRLSDNCIVWDGIELDITATKQAEDELKAAYEQLAASQEELRAQFDALKEREDLIADSEEKYRTFVEHTNDGVFIARDGNLLFVNEAYAEITGYSVEELIGHPFAHIVAPEDREMVLSRHMDRPDGNLLPETYEFSVLQKDGISRRRVRIRVGIGKFQGLPAGIGTLHDVTGEQQREAALLESEERYRRLVYCTFNAVVVYQDSQIVLANDSAARIAGLSSGEELVGKPIMSFIHPDSREHVAARQKQMLESSGMVVPLLSEKFIHTDGTAVDVEVMASSTLYHGKPAVQVLFRDITERKRAEEALIQSEELHRSLFKASPDGIAIVNPKGILTYASPKALDMFGLTHPEEAIGTSVLDWITNDDRTMAGRQFATVLSDSDLLTHTYRVHRKDGSQFFVEMHSAALHDSNGSVSGIISILRDITDRKQAEEALRRSEKEYRNIIESMQDVFYRVNREGIITMISPYGARLVGFDTPSEIIGNYRATDFYADPVERDAFLSHILAEKNVSGYPMTLKDRHGKLHYATASSHIIYDKDGNIDGIEGILHDVTTLKDVENSLRQANRQITLMTSITRHDIHNQLLALTGWLELSKASVKDPDRMKELISRELEITDIIHQQINFTMIFDDMGVKPPVWQEPDLIVEKAHAALPFGNVRLVMDLPRIEVFADPLLEKVFYNLLDNSIRYGGAGMTTVRVHSKKDQESLLIIIEDDGEGIPGEDRGRLFERGFGKHTGLGLFLVKEVLSITNLTIRETGSPGKGARFEITIPAGKYRFISP